MNILVTGGCGFVGSHVVDRLVERGHAVLVEDDLSTAELAEDGETARWRNPGATYAHPFTGAWPVPVDKRVEAVVHLALRHPVERERAVWRAALQGYVVNGARLLMELLDERAPLKRFVLCGPGRAERRDPERGLVDALHALLTYWHRPPDLGVYCAWAPELTGARRATEIPDGELTSTVEAAAALLADLADGTAKHRREPDVYLEVGE